jgi:CheY-like chemotaxis protein
MDKFPKLQKMLTAALNQAMLDGGMLIGHDLTIKESESSMQSKQDYIKALEDASFIVSVKSQEEYDGTFHMVFSLGDAIVMASLLLGVPPNRVSEKKKLAIIDSDDIDAFSEFMNQVIGSCNSVFKPTLPKRVHLKLLEPKKFIPGNNEVNGEEPVPDGDYFLFRAQLDMPQQDLGKLDVIIPKSLASFYDLQGDQPATVAEEDAEPQEGVSAPAEYVAEESTVLILEDNSADREFFQESLSSTDIKALAATLDADLTEFFPDGSVKAVLLGVVNADDRELSICIKIKTISPTNPVPVIMCAREWTRIGVLKALKYGAEDIIIKPCTPDELKGKLLKYMAAA